MYCYKDFIDGNMLDSLKHLLSTLGKTNVSEVKEIQPHTYQHVSRRGIITIIHGYTTYQEYAASEDDGELQRCNGFYFTLKKQCRGSGMTP